MGLAHGPGFTYIARRQHPRLPCPLHRPGHPPLARKLGIDDGVPLLEGDLVTVRSSVVIQSYVVGVMLDEKSVGAGRGGVVSWGV